MWVVNTNAPVPTISSYSNAAILFAHTKGVYLHTLLKWLDDDVPKSINRWKIAIGFMTVYVPSADPKLNRGELYSTIMASLFYVQSKLRLYPLCFPYVLNCVCK
jgi:hypothetical protein